MLSKDFLPIIQLCVAPLFIWALLRLRVGNVRIPRLVILLGVTLSLGAYIGGYSARSFLGRRIAVARFSDDPLGGNSRIFRQQLSEGLARRSKDYVFGVKKPFTSASAIRREFASGRRVDAVVWGRSDAVLVSFLTQKTLGLEKTTDRKTRLEQLQVVHQIPTVQVRRSSEIATIKFLIALFSGLMEGVDLAQREVDFLDAIGSATRWPSQATRALPAWLLGNLYLAEATSSDPIQRGPLDCALKYYSRGASFFKSTDNPELAAAMFNNWAVALYILALDTGNQQYWNDVKKLFERAVATRWIQSSPEIESHSWKKARDNIERIQRALRVRIGGVGRTQGRKKVTPQQ